MGIRNSEIWLFDDVSKINVLIGQNRLSVIITSDLIINEWVEIEAIYQLLKIAKTMKNMVGIWTVLPPLRAWAFWAPWAWAFAFIILAPALAALVPALAKLAKVSIWPTPPVAAVRAPFAALSKVFGTDFSSFFKDQ